ncbi:uncharacterized protein LOC142498604 [Ascaphus truei]|uniref:uncharacterized protein LOC142498604 n=1 Tax=Ascaphus truei TaxID=8439 RepID=UPI003F595E8A
MYLTQVLPLFCKKMDGAHVRQVFMYLGENIGHQKDGEDMEVLARIQVEHPIPVLSHHFPHTVEEGETSKGAGESLQHMRKATKKTKCCAACEKPALMGKKLCENCLKAAAGDSNKQMNTFLLLMKDAVKQSVEAAVQQAVNLAQKRSRSQTSLDKGKGFSSDESDIEGFQVSEGELDSSEQDIQKDESEFDVEIVDPLIKAMRQALELEDTEELNQKRDKLFGSRQKKSRVFPVHQVIKDLIQLELLRPDAKVIQHSESTGDVARRKEARHSTASKEAQESNQNFSRRMHEASREIRFNGRTSSASKKEMWDQITLAVSACRNHVRDRANCRKRFDDIRANLKKKIQAQRMHASGTGGGPPAQSLILTPLEEQMREKILPVVVEGLPGDRDIGIYFAPFPPVAPEAHVSPDTEHVSSPGSSSSSSSMEEPDVATQGQIHSSDHEDVPTPGLTQHSSPPARDTYSAIAASEERILGEENRRHSEMMSVLERMISLQERTISQMSQIERVIIQVPKEIQNVNRTLQAIVVNLSQANQLRITAKEQQFHFSPSEDGSLHASTFSPESSVLHSPVVDDTGTVGASSVQVPVNIQPLISVQNQERTPTNETRKRKLGQQLTSFWKKIKTPKQETAPTSVVQCLATGSQLPQATPSAPEVPQPTPSAPEMPQPTPSATELPHASTSRTVKAKVLAKGKRQTQQPTSRPVTRSQKDKQK